MSHSYKRKSVHWAVKAFVLFHMVLVTGWALPRVSGDRIAQIQSGQAKPESALVIDKGLILNSWIFQSRELPFSMYLTSTGLWQGWDMFSPNPSSTDVYITANVTMEDGTVFTHDFNRIKPLSYDKKFIYERFRKYRERLSGDDMSWKWPQTANWFALQALKSTGKSPVKVEMTRHWMEISGPGKPIATSYNSYMFFETFVDPLEVKRMAGQ